jgi:8-oxo-dGTP diphosphatase
MIIGIAGTLGSGKGTVVDYLVKKKGFKHYYSTDLLIEILEERGEVVDRDGMNRVANELRASDPSGVPAKTYAKYMAEDGKSDVILEALHSVPEVNFVKSVGGVVLGVTADPDIRYERITSRGSVKDNVSKEKFMEQQKREEEGSEDPNRSNIYNAIKEADYVIENNGSIDDLYEKIEIFLKEYSPRVIEKSAWIEIVDRKVLSTRSKGKDTYYIPGGKREANETDFEAVVREIREELSVELDSTDTKQVAVFEAQAHGKPEGTIVRMTCFEGPYSGRIQPSAEIEEIVWISHDDKDKSSPVDGLILDWLKESDRID